jgi:ribosomal protein S18 acetylase RimI-like enzyme
MGVVVRRAVVDDAAGIAAAHAAARLVAYRDFLGHELLSGTFSADKTAIWRARLAAEQPPVVFVAIRDAQVLGYCMVLTPSEDEDSGGVVAELTRMSVIPDAWRSGVGTALVSESLGFLRQSGWATASLWVLEQNARARSFYAGIGFELDGAETVDPWSGQLQVRMRLELTDTA